MNEEELLYSASDLWKREGRLIRLPEDKPVVFVGDTHGDTEATEHVFSRFLDTEAVIVFLGDYVDRGPDSEGNLRLLIETKLAQPERVFLLMGNHEGWKVAAFSPADFWEGLPPGRRRLYSEALSFLPLAALSPHGVLALHAALPDIQPIDEINRIELGSADWRKATWGDWADVPGHAVSPGVFSRPSYGRDYFYEVMERLNLRVLVRSHQPHAPPYLFSDRCLTIFTSVAYGGERRVAVLPPDRAVSTARDLETLYL